MQRLFIIAGSLVQNKMSAKSHVAQMTDPFSRPSKARRTSQFNSRDQTVSITIKWAVRRRSVFTSIGVVDGGLGRALRVRLMSFIFGRQGEYRQTVGRRARRSRDTAEFSSAKRQQHTVKHTFDRRVMTISAMATQNDSPCGRRCVCSAKESKSRGSPVKS